MFRFFFIYLTFYLMSSIAWGLPGEDVVGSGSCKCQDKVCTEEELLYLSQHCESPEVATDASSDENVARFYLCPGCECPDGYFGWKDKFVFPSKFRKLGGSYSYKKTMLSCSKIDDLNINNVLSCLVSKDSDCIVSFGSKSCSATSSLIPPSLLASYRLKRNCGYGLGSFVEGDNQTKFYRDLRALKSDRGHVCYKSMCTSATFLAFVSHMKAARDAGKITQEQFDKHTRWRYGVSSLGYDHININATPDALVEELEIGKGYQQHVSELGQNNVPKQGDLVQLWRRSGTGHSVVFKGLVDVDGDNKYDLICYVSSQKSTNGLGENCEDTSVLDRVIIGSFDEI